MAARRGIVSRSASCPSKPRSPAIIVADLTDFGNAVWLVCLLARCGAAEEQERWGVVANLGFPLPAFVQNLIEMDRAERAAAERERRHGQALEQLQLQVEPAEAEAALPLMSARQPIYRGKEPRPGRFLQTRDVVNPWVQAGLNFRRYPEM